MRLTLEFNLAAAESPVVIEKSDIIQCLTAFQLTFLGSLGLFEILGAILTVHFASKRDSTANTHLRLFKERAYFFASWRQPRQSWGKL